MGAAEYGSVKVLIVASIAIFQRRNPCLTHTCRPVDGRAREGPHDLPRQLDTDGKLIPKHGDTNEGTGMCPISTRPGDILRQLVDSHCFGESLHFAFNEKNIIKTTALDVLGAVRHRTSSAPSATGRALWTTRTYRASCMPTENNTSIKNLGARSRCFCCLDPIPPLRGG